ncbi:MAG: Tm-1-like ATP-binding domain-containing protein [Anaerolineales bacterium]
MDAEGQPFYSPEADAALFKALRENLDPDKVTLIELDMHINDPEFANSMAAHLLEMIDS